MKKIILPLAVLFTLAISSCGSTAKTEATEADTLKVEDVIQEQVVEQVAADSVAADSVATPVVE